MSRKLEKLGRYFFLLYCLDSIMFKEVTYTYERITHYPLSKFDEMLNLLKHKGYLQVITKEQEVLFPTQKALTIYENFQKMVTEVNAYFQVFEKVDLVGTEKEPVFAVEERFYMDEDEYENYENSGNFKDRSINVFYHKLKSISVLNDEEINDYVVRFCFLQFLELNCFDREKGGYKIEESMYMDHILHFIESVKDFDFEAFDEYSGEVIENDDVVEKIIDEASTLLLHLSEVLEEELVADPFKGMQKCENFSFYINRTNFVSSFWYSEIPDMM